MQFELVTNPPPMPLGTKGRRSGLISAVLNLEVGQALRTDGARNSGLRATITRLKATHRYLPGRTCVTRKIDDVIWVYCVAVDGAAPSKEATP